MSRTNMHSNVDGNLAGLTPAECLRLLTANSKTWLLPTFVVGLIALGYAIVMPRFWEASQGLMVRPEVSNATGAAVGKFADLYQMRTFQETILEIAKSPQVISAAVAAVDSEAYGYPVEADEDDIEEMRQHLSLLPPGGAEFGKTEVCYLQVEDTDRQRALKLVAEFAKQIDSRLRELRTEKARSLSVELGQQVARAKAALQGETDRLATFEARVGADLGELRMLNASFSGQSDLRQQAVQLNDERRAAETGVRQAEQLLKVLRSSQDAPEKLIAMPSALLASQPTLRRLKDGLVDAQLRAARLEGTRTANHPQVRAAQESVKFIREDLHNELAVAARGVEVELQLGKSRAAKLEQQHQEVQDRLARLAELRAGYDNRMSAVENSREVLDQAQTQLGQVDAQLVAASSTNLVTPIDQPETGPNPGGPGRASVVLVGIFGGFALGVGWIFLTASPSSGAQVRDINEGGADSGERSTSEPVAPVDPVANVPTTPRMPESPQVLPSSLPLAVSDKIAEILAARDSVAAVKSRD